METKFTPGPWETNGLRIWAKVMFSESRALELATMSHFVPSTEREATARLIAAAPELFEALQSLVFWYAKRAGNDMLPDAEQEPEIVAARAAIAKATGEQA